MRITGLGKAVRAVTKTAGAAGQLGRHAMRQMSGGAAKVPSENVFAPGRSFGMKASTESPSPSTSQKASAHAQRWLHIRKG